MNDLTKLSDADLMAALQSSAPAADLSKMSDADLMAALGQPMAAPASVPTDDPRADPAAASSKKFLEGVPVLGAYIPQASAAISAAAQPLTGVGSTGETFSDRYAKNLAQEKSISATTDREHPVLSTALQIGGGAAALAPAVVAAPAAFGVGSAPLLARAGLSAITGSGISGADAAARSGGDAGEIKKGMLVGGGMGFAGPRIAQGVGKIVGGLVNRAKPVSVPTAPELKAASDAAYQAADNAGVKFAQPSFSSFVDDLGTMLQKKGLDPTITPGSVALLARMQKTTTPTLSEVDTLRQIAGMISAGEKKLGSRIVRSIDDYVDSARPADVLSGDPAAGAAAIKEARSLWSAQAKSETISKAVAKATRRAESSGSGGNIDNALRQGIRSILDSEKKSRGFTAVEKGLMESIVRGSKGSNFARLAGKLSPSGNGLSLLLHGGAGVASGGATIPFAIAGAGAKSIADRSTRANVDKLAQAILNRGVVPQSQASIAASDQAKRIAHALLNPAPLVANRQLSSR